MSYRASRHGYHQLPFWGLLLAGLTTLVFGCGPDYKARANVKGKVTMGKKNLTSGTVVFHNKNGITSTSPIDTQGNYVMNDAPIGECIITVTVAGLPADPSVRARIKSGGKDPSGKESGSQNPDGGPGIALMPEMPKHIVMIPDKFGKTETSGLTYKVEKGEHIHDIEF